MDKLPLSVALISFNEEHNIARTLEAIVDLADEIILVDSHSTDRTIEIAKSFGAKVFVEDWKGYIEQKNSALFKCTNEWILALDCDEVVTSELKASIQKAIQSNELCSYYINRRTVYLGKTLKFAWQPDLKLRLVHKKNNPRWEGINPHDELVAEGRKKELEGELLHYSYKNLKHHFEKTLYYSRISAETYFKMGKKFNIFKLLFNPAFSFFRLYLLRLGFLDGIRGFIAAVSAYLTTFLKYSFLWEIQNRNSNERTP